MVATFDYVVLVASPSLSLSAVECHVWMDFATPCSVSRGLIERQPCCSECVSNPHVNLVLHCLVSWSLPNASSMPVMLVFNRDSLPEHGLVKEYGTPPPSRPSTQSRLHRSSIP